MLGAAWKGWGRRFGAALAALALALVLVGAPQRVEAQISNPEACSGPIMDMMSDGMVFVYLNTAWMCMGMCDQMMGTFFMQVLEDKNLTMDFMECALNNPELIDVMIRVAAMNPEVLYKMGAIIGVDCDFADVFSQMALYHSPLRGFFFWAINDHLYTNLTHAMLCEPPHLVRNFGAIMLDDARHEMQPGRAFWDVYMELGSSTNTLDGNELADERMYYGFFHDLEAARMMFNALGTLEPSAQVSVLEHMFLGKSEGLSHPDQLYFHAYAIIEAFVVGVAPHYDLTLPPDPASENPANALFGQMLGLFATMDEQGQITGFTPYAQAFFRALRSAAEVHCEPHAMAMMHFMGGIFPLELFQAFPQADPDAPAPRDYKSDGHQLTYSCPEPECGLFAPMLCVDQTSCESAGLSWCAGQCMAATSCPPVECSKETPTACEDALSCVGQGLFWCDERCQLSSCIEGDILIEVVGVPLADESMGDGEPSDSNGWSGDFGGNPPQAVTAHGEAACSIRAHNQLNPKPWLYFWGLFLGGLILRAWRRGRE